jgi:DNA ligase-1
MIRQVMLAAKFDSFPELAAMQMRNIKFPVLASTKIDGIRAHTYKGLALSRKNKLIPNCHVQELMATLPEHLDGELTVGPPTAPNVFNYTQSAVMSQDGRPDFTYWVFDMVDESGNNSASLRQQVLNYWIEANPDKFPFVIAVKQQLIYSLEALFAFEEECILQGWEGIMIRDLYGPYKQGRATLREGWLIKLKRFEDSEAEILGCYEQETNTNVAVINEVGRSKRSSHQEGKVFNGHLGGFHVRDIHTGVEFEVGTMQGVTKDQRYTLWKEFLINPQCLLGKVIKYKFQPVGVKNKPRQPIYLGFRNQIDI